MLGKPWLTLAQFGAAALAIGAACCGPSMAQPVQPDVSRRVTEAIVRNGLIGLPPECVLFMPTGETASYLDLEVRERHGGTCPGDPATSPRLFMLRYDKGSGVVLKQSIDPGVGYVPLR